MLRSEIVFLADKEFRPAIVGVLRLSTQQVTQQKLVTIEVKSRVDLRSWFQTKIMGTYIMQRSHCLSLPLRCPEKIRRLIKVHSALRYRFISGHKICYARVDKIERIMT